ncbi:FecCD family ABC transporter permease [Marinobacter xestospongiae]|uniref:FecCD family ABC transporter permease n=1 Tax=Marinobacter xestospongiae TaxID=994319 RepID=UPI002003E3C4|nr:iron ABC transporter permease [Marinobacter xestospongiae]MCK7566728.1 iron ABC transporter permease [Marinobacter xestospongiae]
MAAANAETVVAERGGTVRRWPALAMLVVMLLALVLASLRLGTVALDWGTLYRGMVSANPADFPVLWNLRLPRTLLAVVVGAQFALSGLILQRVIRNPLADPGVVGVSGGAGLAVVILLLLSDLLPGVAAGVGLAGLPWAALVGGLMVAALVLALAWRNGLAPARLALTGIAVGAVLNAAVMWVVVVWGGSRTETTLMWLAGSLYGRDFSHLWLLLPWTLAGLLALLPALKPLSLLRFGDHQAQTLGLAVQRWRLLALAVAVVLAASAVAVAGPMGFVGLIVPHLARLLARGSFAAQVPVCLLLGGVLTLAADIVGRTLASPLELPAGALTTLLGIPVLLYLLIKQGGRS